MKRTVLVIVLGLMVMASLSSSAFAQAETSPAAPPGSQTLPDETTDDDSGFCD